MWALALGLSLAGSGSCAKKEAPISAGNPAQTPTPDTPVATPTVPVAGQPGPAPNPDGPPPAFNGPGTENPPAGPTPGPGDGDDDAPTAGPGPVPTDGDGDGTPPRPSDGGDGDDGVAPEPPELAVTADFLNGTLSIVDVGKLTPGSRRADALVGTVDLSGYAPGPMSLQITPDGKTALVSVSSGFIGAFITVPPGEGTLLFVDIAEQKVTGELKVGDSPMGIVVTPDSKRAFVGLYAERYFAVVDIENKTFETVSTGASYNEELAIDDSGTVAILTYGPTGNVRTFAVDAPMGALGQTVGLTGDAAGVAFFPGTKTAYLMQAPTILTGNLGGHDLIDVSNPARPVASDGVRRGNHPSTYPVTAVAARGSIAFPESADGMLWVVEMVLTDGKAVERKRVEVGPAESVAYGLTATRDGRVLVAVGGEHYIGVVDLEAGTAFTVPWEVSMSGPTEIKVVP